MGSHTQIETRSQVVNISRHPKKKAPVLLIAIGLPQAAVQDLRGRVMDLFPAVETAALAQGAHGVGEGVVNIMEPRQKSRPWQRGGRRFRVCWYPVINDDMILVTSILTMVYKATNITVGAPPCMNLDDDMILKDSTWIWMMITSQPTSPYTV